MISHKKLSREGRFSLLATQGFTLLELLIALTIVSILAAIAAPSFRETIIQSRITTGTDNLISSLTLTRSEAIKRGTTVTILQKIKGDWRGGWCVMEGEPNDCDDTEALMVQPKTIEITIDANQEQYTFNALGNLDLQNEESISICTAGSTRGKSIFISPLGQVVVQTKEDCA